MAKYKCAKCGEILTVEDGLTEIYCEFCGQKLRVKNTSTRNYNKQNNETDEIKDSIGGWKVFVLIVIPTFIIQYLFSPGYRLAYVLGGTLGASLMTFLMSMVGDWVVHVFPLSKKAKKLMAILVGFIIYYGLNILVATILK